MKKWMLCFALVLTLLLTACGETPAGEGCDTLPGGFDPVLQVNGTHYRWTGIAIEHQRVLRGTVYNPTRLMPDGYTEVGEIRGVTEELPTEDFQLQAGFEATGRVFVSEETPEAVYVCMTTDWFEEYYIRFISDALRNNECIAYQGQPYRFTLLDSTVVKELPDECELIGKLTYVGENVVPVNDLETNRRTDGFNKNVQGREVYGDPDDGSVLYVYEHHYWAEGDYPAWRVCPLWGE